MSLTSAVGKLLEGILSDRIYRHLERQGLIRDSQHGFVSGKSCLTNLIEFFEGVTKKVDEGSAVDVVYMDFSQAFDKVPHGSLLHLVQSHTIKGEVAKWVQNCQNGGCRGLFFKLEACDKRCASGISAESTVICHLYHCFG